MHVLNLILLAALISSSNGSSPPLDKPVDIGILQQSADRERRSGGWVQSLDRQLELRLSVADANLTGEGEIELIAELRNAGSSPITVIRPFGDWYFAASAGVRIWSGDELLRYGGPTPGYSIGTSAFAILEPGEIVEERLTLPNENYVGVGQPGEYMVRYDYAYVGEWDEQAAARNSGITGAWRGTIASREIPMTRR